MPEEIRPDPASGLLPEGRWEMDWPRVRSLFVDQGPQQALRGAVYSSLVSWCAAAREHFGGGQLLIGGGFVTHSEPTVTARAYFVADDPLLVLKAFDAGGVGWQMVTLDDVVFGDPHGGGGLRSRSAVGGLVDSYLVADGDEILSWRALSYADLPGAGFVPVRKGIIQVEVPR